jgi:hypothetical protein
LYLEKLVVACVVLCQSIFAGSKETGYREHTPVLVAFQKEVFAEAAFFRRLANEFVVIDIDAKFCANRHCDQFAAAAELSSKVYDNVVL